jgi:hypothetical protein
MKGMMTLEVPVVFPEFPVGDPFGFQVMLRIISLVPAKLKIFEKHKPFQFLMILPACGAAGKNRTDKEQNQD